MGKIQRKKEHKKNLLVGRKKFTYEQGSTQSTQVHAARDCENFRNLKQFFGLPE